MLVVLYHGSMLTALFRLRTWMRSRWESSTTLHTLYVQLSTVHNHKFAW